MTSATSSPPKTRSIIGPLTTTFTPPANCTSLAAPVSFDTGDGSESSISNSQAQKCSWVSEDGIISSIAYDDVACWPSATGSVPSFSFNTSDDSPVTALNGWGIYSPGLICPHGYTTACWAEASSHGPDTTTLSGPSFEFQFGLLPGETAIGCCPRGYQCFGAEGVNSFQTCLSMALTGSIETYTCPPIVPRVQNSFEMATINVPLLITAIETEAFPDTATAQASLSGDPIRTGQGTTYVITETSTTSSFSLLAPMFQLNWKASDRPPPPTSAPQSLDNSTSSPASSSGSLPIGAKAAIGVVVPVVVLIVAAILIAWLLKRRKQKVRRIPQPEYQDKPELDATNLSQPTFEQSQPIEMSASNKPVEIGEDVVHELPAPNTVQELENLVPSSDITTAKRI